MSELTKDERESLIDFIEAVFIDYVRSNSDVDNIYWICNVCSAYRKLKEGGEE